ncbi:MAG: HIT family protein [Planctomycetota bacterium]
MPTLFERIVAGEIPCRKVWEDDDHLAFLDIAPRVEGHTLVIPKRPTDYLFDLESDAYLSLWSAVRTVEQHLRTRLEAKRVLVYVVGWEVPHVHVHLMPTSDIADVAFPAPDPAAEAKLDETHARLA